MGRSHHLFYNVEKSAEVIVPKGNCIYGGLIPSASEEGLNDLSMPFVWEAFQTEIPLMTQVRVGIYCILAYLRNRIYLI